MCLRPINKKIDGKVVQLPCGKCLECVKKYQNHWVMRLIEESKHWRYSYLLNLSYANENLPYIELDFANAPYNETDKLAVYGDYKGIGDYLYDEYDRRYFVVDNDAQAQARFDYVYKVVSKLNNKHVNKLRQRKNTEYCNYLIADNIQDGIKVPVVNYDDVQRWIKRARTRYERDHDGEKMDFKYFLCSEYGPNTFRPHYHVLLFCNTMLSYDIINYFIKDWEYHYGDVQFSNKPVHGNSRSIDGNDVVSTYVSKYCLKPAELENPYVVCGLIPRPFRKMSNGIGAAFKDNLVNQVRDLAKTFNINLDDMFYKEENKISDIFDEFDSSMKRGDIDCLISNRKVASFQDRRDFIECLFNKLRYFRGGYFYSMCRYWRDAVFPQTLKEGMKYNKKTNKYEKVFRKAKDTEHFICLLYKEYVESRYFDSIQKYEDLARSEFPDGEDMVISRRAEVLMREDMARRNRESWTKLYNTYYGNSFKSEF